MRICEIFKSISGESLYAGYVTTFIRAYGCNINCSYCDSSYSCAGSDYKEMSIDEIISEVEKLECKRIVFTGGEPLIQKDALDLVKALLNLNYFVEIETNGAVDISDIIGLHSDKCIVTMDWKCPSSNMNSRMISQNLAMLRGCDVLKFVVGSEQDLDEMKSISKLTIATSFASPVFGKLEPKDIVQYLIDNKLHSIRFQLQIHKYVWPMDMRGV